MVFDYKIIHPPRGTVRRFIAHQRVQFYRCALAGQIPQSPRSPTVATRHPLSRAITQEAGRTHRLQSSDPGVARRDDITEPPTCRHLLATRFPSFASRHRDSLPSVVVLRISAQLGDRPVRISPPPISAEAQLSKYQWALNIRWSDTPIATPGPRRSCAATATPSRPCADHAHDNIGPATCTKRLHRSDIHPRAVLMCPCTTSSDPELPTDRPKPSRLVGDTTMTPGEISRGNPGPARPAPGRRGTKVEV